MSARLPARLATLRHHIRTYPHSPSQSLHTTSTASKASTTSTSTPRTESKMADKKPWHAALPSPKATPPPMTVEALHELTQSARAGKDYIVVDVRRTDIDEPEGAFIHPGAINLPAQTFYQTLPRIFTVLQNVPKVIFHCNSCKPGGRGPRAAGWYQDHLDAKGWTASQAYVLEGGFKAWKAQYPDDLIPVSV